MVIEIKVPELGESITEGTIAHWLKNAGDTVNEGDILVEIETDKVNLEVNAEHNGQLKEIVKQTGDTVEVGEVIAILEEHVQEAPQQTAAEPASPTAADPAVQTKEASVQSEEETPSRTDAASPGEAAELADHQQDRRNVDPSPSPLVASPGARKLAREQGIDLNRVRAQDPRGRITADDVKAYAEASRAGEERAGGSPPQAEPAAGSNTDGRKAVESKTETGTDAWEKPVERIRMSRRRQTIARRLVEAQHQAAMLTTFNEVDMTAILDIRRRRKASFREEHDVNLGFMSFFTKAVVGALKSFPLLNAEIQGDEMVVKKYYDIGIAVATEEGLVVPVVRNADRLSFAEIEQEIASLAEKARSNTLSLRDLQGGTFTITNGGVFGSLLSTPILNTPQVGILGMHKIQKRPVAVDDDRMENRPMMYIALSYDHRIVDGSEAVSFLVKIKNMLEDPEVLLLEG